jgi:hypothetical protein
MDKVIDAISKTVGTWTKYSFEIKVLEVCVLNGKSTLDRSLTRLMPIFVTMASVELDVEIRERFF